MAIFKQCIAVILTVCLTACASGAHRNTIPVNAVTEPLKEYRIGKGDTLDIKFFYNPELNEQVVVRPDGRITLQLAKEIPAEGLTPAQLTEVLSSHYATQINNPDVTVILRTFSGQKIFVDGEVNRAGMVILTDPMTVLQAVSQAGGLKETAEASTVLVLRRAEGNRIVTSKINLQKVMGDATGNDMLLMPNDIVLVPRSGIANVDLWVDQYIRKLIPFPIGVGLGLTN